MPLVKEQGHTLDEAVEAFMNLTKNDPSNQEFVDDSLAYLREIWDSL